MTTKNTHGGAGRGQGRKSQYSEKLKPVTIHLTDYQKETLKFIGGGQAVREWLNTEMIRIGREAALSYALDI